MSIILDKNRGRKRPLNRSIKKKGQLSICQTRARFLAEELAIGDAEDAIEELRCQLANESLKGTEEYDFLFQATTALQKELLEKRLAHKPVAHEGRL